MRKLDLPHRNASFFSHFQVAVRSKLDVSRYDQYGEAEAVSDNVVDFCNGCHFCPVSLPFSTYRDGRPGQLVDYLARQFLAFRNPCASAASALAKNGSWPPASVAILPCDRQPLV
jgi:hypothetical protein